MTPKEKANELWAKMLGGYEGNELTIEIDKLIAKQDALICVDEVLKSQEKSNDGYGGHSLTNLEIEFYQEVKQEIIKL